jgi:ribosomal-protein-alanine N-acetyltransferase
MKAIEIVEITAEQVTALDKIGRQAFADGSWTREQIISCLTPSYWLRGLVHEKVLIGFVIFHPLVDDTELCCIAIAPVSQGEGYGKFLLDYSLKAMQDLGYHKIFLEVRVSNWPAISLYQHRGFKEIHRRKAYYVNRDGTREDAVVMEYKFTQDDK